MDCREWEIPVQTCVGCQVKSNQVCPIIQYKIDVLGETPKEEVVQWARTRKRTIRHRVTGKFTKMKVQGFTNTGLTKASRTIREIERHPSSWCNNYPQPM